MIDIARHGGRESPVPLAAVALRTDLSHGYLEHLATELRRARLLQGVAGRKGGYMLRSEPSRIRISDVVEAAIGEVCLVDCVLRPSLCVRAAHCETRTLYCLLNHRIEDALRSLTLADLMKEDWLAQHGGGLDPDSPAAARAGPDPCSGSLGPRRGRRRAGRPSVRPRTAAERSSTG